MRYLEKIRKKYEAPLDEERVWINEYGQHGDVDVDKVESTVEDRADKIETTFNCVTDVFRAENRFRITGTEETVILAIILSRNADKELFDQAMSTVNHGIMDQIHRKYD